MAPPLRVLVVDDSVINRASIESVLAAHAGIEVIGRAKNGEEALQIALGAKPDVITLDLEMPRMDGFTFLRILMSKRPTPVIVVSSYGNKETVFRALELGAIDFVARNDGRPEDRDHLKKVVEKVLLARHLRPLPTLAPKPIPEPARGRPPLESFDSIKTRTLKYVVVIAASTGGPTALIEIFSRLPLKFPGAILVAQHMPDRFTKTFAERLDKRGQLHVRETRDGDAVVPQEGYVSPGGLVTRLRPAPPGSPAEFTLAVSLPTLNDRYAPSADALMESAAQHAGSRAMAIVLTGMGDDGVAGARAIRAAGGRVVAESDQTAVVHGMPGAAIRSGVVDKVLPLGDIATFLATLT